MSSDQMSSDQISSDQIISDQISSNQIWSDDLGQTVELNWDKKMEETLSQRQNLKRNWQITRAKNGSKIGEKKEKSLG